MENILHVWLHVPPRSCPNLQGNMWQAQAVIPSTTYSKVLLRYLRGMFSCCFASRIAKQSEPICIIIVYIS